MIIIMELLEKLVPKKISECSISVVTSADKVGNAPTAECGTCMSEKMAKIVAQEFVPEVSLDESPKKIVEIAKRKLNCDSEKCILKKTTHPQSRAELETRFKVEGPNDNKLLSNVNIDSVMKQWMSNFSGFFAYNFNMLDYADHSLDNLGRVLDKPDTLATIDFRDLYSKQFRIAACVINSDVYRGPGKHWMVLMADARSKDEWSIEFFNCSGNPPAPEWVNWMQKTKMQMESIRDHPRITLAKSNVRHQYSNTECGVYSLFYIWARLCGVKKEILLNTPIPDRLMFMFRQHLFEDSFMPSFLQRITTNGEFDWDKYQKQVRIKWIGTTE